MSTDVYRTGPVRFAYGNGPLCLDTTDIEIPRGQVTVLAGENGSGKTTFLKLLAGLLTQPGGKRNHDFLGRISEDAVYLHQTPYLFRGTVARNLSLASGAGRRMRHSEEREAELRRALAAVGLSGLAGRRTGSLSGGEKKRVALARVFLSNRPLLLLDEPAAHADATSVLLIEEGCRTFAAAGKAVVVATHRGGFGYRVADGLFDLNDGKLEQSATNILNGEVVRHDGGFLHFKSGDATFRAPLTDGLYRVAVVAAEDVLLSRHPLDSSARNCLVGRLDVLEPTSHGLLRARIDCGMMLTSLVTAGAVTDLGLTPGSTVYATFKASSVRLY